MIWLSWRQFRTQAVVTAAILAVLAVLLLVTGLHLAALYPFSWAPLAWVPPLTESWPTAAPQVPGTGSLCFYNTSTLAGWLPTLAGWLPIAVPAAG